MKWIGAFAVCVAAVAAGLLLGPRLAGSTVQETEIGDVSYRLNASATGGLEGYVPITDWGVRFDGPPVPFRLRVELRTLDREALLRATEGDRRLIDATEEQLREGAITALRKTLLWSFGITLVLLVLVCLVWRGLRPRWVPVAIGVPIFVLAIAAAGLATRNTIDDRTFGSPTFFASGAELQRILEVIDTADVESPYGSEFESIVRSIGAVLATGDEPDSGLTGMYLGGDLHANALVVRPLSRLVEGEPLLLNGDFGQQGTRAESALLVPRIAALGRRVVAVSGNHDSASLMRDLAAAGVTVLDHRGTLEPDGTFRPPPVVSVDGIDVAGWADPFEIGGTDPAGAPGSSFEELEDPDAARAEWVSRMLRWFDSLGTKPDVLMIHQSSLASLFARAVNEAGYDEPLTIATGHSHDQYLEKVGSVTVVNPGSSGAGGVFEAGESGIGLAHLRFEPDGALRSAELILAEPFSGAAQATRVVIDTLCPDEQECRVEVPDRLDEDPGPPEE